MPAPLTNIDWNLAKSLYCQGIPQKEIAAKIGVKLTTLLGRIKNQGWVALKRESLSVISQTIANSSVRTLGQRTKAIREQLIQDAERSVQVLCSRKDLDPKKMKLRRFHDREALASTIQKRAWSTLGLDAASASGTVVNIAVMSAASDAEQPEVLPPAAAIDVEKGS